MITKELVESLAADCDRRTGDAVLDNLFDKYNEGSPRGDRPLYYRLLFRIAPSCSVFIELGCHYGAASLHFLKGNPHSFSFGVDCASRLKDCVASEPRFRFLHGRSDNLAFINAMPDKWASAILIDSDHSYETTRREFLLWEPKVKPGGIVLFDDIDAPEYADGCGKFFQELDGEKLSLPQLHPVNWGFGVWFKK